MVEITAANNIMLSSHLVELVRHLSSSALSSWTIWILCIHTHGLLLHRWWSRRDWSSAGLSSDGLLIVGHFDESKEEV